MKLSITTNSAALIIFPSQNGEGEEGAGIKTFIVGIHLDVPEDASSRTITSLGVTLNSYESLGVSIINKFKLPLT